MKKLGLLVLLLAFSLPATAAPQPLRVVTSFSILANMVTVIGEDAVTVTSLVGPDGDTHSYQPTPEDAKTLAGADLIFINGLGFEGWMPRLIAASGTKARVVTVTDNLKTRIIYSLKGVPDPHAWQNLDNGRLYARAIAEALEQARPGQAQAIYQRELTYETAITQMDRYVRAQLATIPTAKRKVIINHDAFAYFGAAYGVPFVAPTSLANEAEPSAADVAGLVGQIKSEKIKVVFAENMSNTALLRQIAKDSGAAIGGILYADALSANNSEASTYLGLFRKNVNTLKDGLLRN